MTAGYQSSHGNDQAWAASRKAIVTGSAGAGANLLQSAANAGLAYLNRSNGDVFPIPNSSSKSGTHGFPLQEIDLDADRKYDTTWNIGGGAVQVPGGNGPELEVSGHRQWGPNGYAGSDFELKGKQTLPGEMVDLTGGIKKEWDGEGNAKTTYGLGAEQPHTGSKGGYEATVGPDGKTENKVTWVAPWEIRKRTSIHLGLIPASDQDGCVDPGAEPAGTKTGPDTYVWRGPDPRGRVLAPIDWAVLGLALWTSRGDSPSMAVELRVAVGLSGLVVLVVSALLIAGSNCVWPVPLTLAGEVAVVIPVVDGKFLGCANRLPVGRDRDTWPCLAGRPGTRGRLPYRYSEPRVLQSPRGPLADYGSWSLPRHPVCWMRP